MKLNIIERSAERKSDAKKLRRDGFIPAVLYSKGQVGENIAIKKEELNAGLRHLRKGRLSTTKITLVDASGAEREAIIKEIQYNVVNYDVISLDFEELHQGRPVTVNVPIECVRVDECIGVKLGGALRQTIRQVPLKCLPEDMPEALYLDVSGLQMQQTLRLQDIQWSEKVRPLMALKEVAVVVGKK